MDRKPGQKKPAKAADARAERLKSALKANLARRKGQARARAEADPKAGQEDKG